MMGDEGCPASNLRRVTDRQDGEMDECGVIRWIRSLLEAGLFCALTFGTLMVSAARAEDAKKKAAPPAWAVQCSGAGDKLACKAYQTIAMRKTMQPVLTVSIQRNSDGKSAALLYSLPHGLFLPAGVKTNIDGAHESLIAVQTCDKRACYAGDKVSAEEIASLRKGKKITVSFKNLKEQDLSIDVPLNGFDAAYKNLR
jgi:invasion protein IalB